MAVLFRAPRPLVGHRKASVRYWPEIMLLDQLLLELESSGVIFYKSNILNATATGAYLLLYALYVQINSSMVAYLTYNITSDYNSCSRSIIECI